jgi:hypothetical protein
MIYYLCVSPARMLKERRLLCILHAERALGPAHTQTCFVKTGESLVRTISVPWVHSDRNWGRGCGERKVHCQTMVKQRNPERPTWPSTFLLPHWSISLCDFHTVTFLGCEFSHLENSAIACLFLSWKRNVFNMVMKEYKVGESEILGLSPNVVKSLPIWPLL